jgi:hypothetical protein
MKNSVKSKAKLSKLEKSTNKYILLMILIQMIICGSAAMYSTVWTLYHSDEFPYLDMDPY